MSKLSYSQLAQFYDTIIAPNTKDYGIIQSSIQRKHPTARTLLELGCGTGRVLSNLRKSYDVTGVDCSAAMLAIARKKLRSVQLFKQDISELSLDRRFDVIICVFDTLNHLTTFKQWERCFACVRHHLNPKGLFLFDINTQQKLEHLAQLKTAVIRSNPPVTLVKINSLRGNKFEWNIRMFVPKRANSFDMLEERILEVSYPVERVAAALKKYFKRIEMFDFAGRKPTRKTERVYFSCRA